MVKTMLPNDRHGLNNYNAGLLCGLNLTVQHYNKG